MPYELNQADILDFANTVNTSKHQKGDELFFQLCPYCNGGEGKDKNTFSINLSTGAFKCFRSSCGKQGHFVELARDRNYHLEFEEEKPKKFKLLPQKEVVVRPKAIEYMASRGISEATTAKYQITTKKDDNNTLVFPFKDENSLLTCVKYRNIDPNYKGKTKEYFEKGTKPILFGMAQCRGFERLIISEGQIDTLSIAESGIENAVSVPTGAMGFKWLEYCWDWVSKFKEIVVFSDCTNGKLTLLDTLQKRLKTMIKAVQVEDYLGEKDANDILRKYGKQAIVKALENAKPPPMKYVKRLCEVKNVDIYGLPNIKTGIREIDRLVYGLFYGQFIILSGKAGEGKSTFLSQIITEATEQGKRSFIYSGELPNHMFKNWIDFQFAGKKHLKPQRNEFDDVWYIVPHATAKKIGEWYADKLFIYDNTFVGEGDEYETLLQTIEKTIRQYDVNLICIDNLMTAIDVDMKSDLYRSQTEFIKSLKKMAERFDVVVILVAHQNKYSGEFTNDNISGASEINKLADLVINYARNKDENSSFESCLHITKNRLTGRITSKDGIGLYYSDVSKRITSHSSNTNKTYGWERNETPEDDFETPF